MRRLRTVPPLAIAALIACSVAGCLPLDPAPLPTIAPTGTPLFSSDEEALAAAEGAYAAYLAVVDEALATLEDSAIRAVASGNALAAASESVEQFRSSSYRQTGTSFFDTTSIAQSSESRTGQVFLQIYACIDISGTDVIDGEGTSVVSLNRLSRYPVLISLETAASSQRLVVIEEEVWDGQSFC